MARVLLSTDEQTQLTDAQNDLIELKAQIESGIDEGFLSPSLLTAVNDQLAQIDVLMTNIV